jgi:DNA (cytosine-5)-methyltransferase 1
MENTIISNEEGNPENILDLLGRRLHPLGYTIRSTIIDFRDLGVPHHRQRLITIGCRIPSLIEKVPIGQIFQTFPSMFHPPKTHGGDNQPGHISMRESIGHMPKLDSLDKTVDDKDPYHHIPKWSEHHYFCMSHTPEGQTAFHNNTCIACDFSANDLKDVDCKECGEKLPKPQIEVEEWECHKCHLTHKKSKSACDCGLLRSDDVLIHKKRRLIRGFKTSYRRLKWDNPASTITMNSGVISSDMKGHPEQNRVLSVREILILSTLESHPGVDYPWDNKYQFKSVDDSANLFHDGNFSPKLIRQVIGESIPPLAMYKIVSRLKELDPRIEYKCNDKANSNYQSQLSSHY